MEMVVWVRYVICVHIAEHKTIMYRFSFVYVISQPQPAAASHVFLASKHKHSSRAPATAKIRFNAECSNVAVKAAKLT